MAMNEGLRKARCVRRYIKRHGKRLIAKARRACKVKGARRKKR